jgi:hypothetical protein
MRGSMSISARQNDGKKQPKSAKNQKLDGQ